MDRSTRPVNAPPARPLLAGLRQAGLALPLLLGACSYIDAPVIARGHHVTEDQLREITPGVQSRADVQTLLGSPTASSTFDDSSWYYISAATRLRPGQRQAVTDQRVVAIEFDENGKVRQVRELNAADARPVTVVSRETPVPGNERTLLQALFGNVGRFGPGPSAMSGTATASPGSPGSGSGR